MVGGVLIIVAEQKGMGLRCDGWDTCSVVV